MPIFLYIIFCIFNDRDVQLRIEFIARFQAKIRGLTLGI